MHLIQFNCMATKYLILEVLIQRCCVNLQSGLTLSSDGILGPVTSDLPLEGLDLSDVPPAVVTE